jgi:prepilin-type processing-associated H-X9-DG protein
MKLRTTNKRRQAWTLKEVLVVTFISVVLIGLILLEQPISSVKLKSPRIMCASNLQHVGVAFRDWEEDHNGHYPMQGFTNELGVMEYPKASNLFRCFQVMSNYLGDPKVLVCPVDDRKPARDFASLKNDNLSYFVGLDAMESQTNMLLAGDRNLVVDGVSVGPGLLTLTTTNRLGWTAAMHKGVGNVLMVDGSVRIGISSGLQQLIEHSGTNMNRLAVP